MDPVERNFIAFWLKEREQDQMTQIGRLLGVFFKAGEVRRWKESGPGGGSGYDDEDHVLVPLSFMIRPESREGIQRLVGTEGLALPKEYQKAANETVVDLGQVSPEAFKEFVNRNRVTDLRG